MSGTTNNSALRDQDSGVVQLGGELVIFKGHNHVVRSPFIN